MDRVTITKGQEKRFVRIGNTLIKKKDITGFQLEDYNPNQGKALIYGHDSPSHLNIVNRQLHGTMYPRTSFYRWDKNWKPGKNTKLFLHKTLAAAKEKYIEAKPKTASFGWLSQNIISGFYGEGKRSIEDSWKVPDVRVYGETQRPNFKNAWLVTKKIDRNSRFATIITARKKLQQVQKDMEGERVKPILVSNYRNYSSEKKHSLWDFIDSLSK